MCAVPLEARRGHHIHRNWCHRQLWAAVWMLGLYPWSSAGAAAALPDESPLQLYSWLKIWWKHKESNGVEEIDMHLEGRTIGYKNTRKAHKMAPRAISRSCVKVEGETAQSCSLTISPSHGNTPAIIFPQRGWGREMAHGLTYLLPSLEDHTGDLSILVTHTVERELAPEVYLWLPCVSPTINKFNRSH